MFGGPRGKMVFFQAKGSIIITLNIINYLINNMEGHFRERGLKIGSCSEVYLQQGLNLDGSDELNYFKFMFVN